MTTTTTRVEYRVIRREYYIQPYQEEPGSITFCDSGPTFDHPLPYHSGKTTQSLEDIKKWDAAQVGLWTEDTDEQDAGNDANNYDGSLYYLQIKQDGEWIEIKILTPVGPSPYCGNCDDHGCSMCDPDCPLCGSRLCGGCEFEQ